MIADEICAKLVKAKQYINKDGDLTFYLHSIEDAQTIKGLLYEWSLKRRHYGPWEQDGDHWDHKHPDGVTFHHPTKGCPEFG